MTTSMFNGIAVFESPSAFSSNPSARRCWNDAAITRINGWGLIDAELHRVSAIKGNSLVHFAPEGSDFNNPVVLSTEQMALTLQTAKEWCRANSFSVTRESILETIHEEIKKSARAISSMRKDVLETQSLDDKLLAQERVRVLQSTLNNQRLKLYAAEDAVDDCIRAGTLEAFGSVAQPFPKVALLIEQFLKKRTVLVTNA